MQVTVKTLDSETRIFTVSEEATVEEFKRQIASEVNIPAERQRLIFKGKVLQDSTKLHSYGVDGCVIHLVERRPPTQRTHPDGASSDRSTSNSRQTGDGHGADINLTPDVMNLSQQIVQGLVSQLGLNSAQANVSTSQSGDGSTLNVHINLLASANAANDAGLRIARARQFLRAARNSLNRSEGESSVLPESMDTTSSSTGTPSSDSNSQQSDSQPSISQNNTPDVLADVLGELLELNSTVQPHLQRYRTLLNSHSTENLLPSDDSLPDRVAEALHNLSHAYHALSDLTFNFRSPEPRRLNVLPSLSNHVGASPFLSSLFSGGGPPTAQSGQQMPSGSGDTRVHVVPGPAIAFTSIISGSLPPSGIYSQQPGTTSTGGTSRSGTSSMFNLNFGSVSSHGNTQRTSSSSTTSGSTTTSTQSTTQGGGGGDNVRIVMDDFVALFANGQPVTSHSETSRTSTTTPSQEHSQGDTDTQSTGTNSASRAVPRINIGSMPLNTNHQDPSVPCESFHFGPRSRPTQEPQTEGNNQSSQANGLAQAFSDAVASVLQDTMAVQTPGSRPSDQRSAGQTANSTTRTNRPTTGPSQSREAVDPLLHAISAMQNMDAEEHQASSQTASGAQNQRNPTEPMVEMLQAAIMNIIRGEGNPHTTINDFLNEAHQAAGGSGSVGTSIEGTYLNRLIDRYGRTLSLQDLIFMLMGMQEPYSRLHDLIRTYLMIDLLEGAQPTDENIRHMSSQVTSEILNIFGPYLERIPPAEGVDVRLSIGAFLVDAINRVLIMSRDLDDVTFASRFLDHLKRSATDLCILLTMCFRDGLRGATDFVSIRLPPEMTPGINETIMQTSQASAVHYVETAYRERPQREQTLRQFIKTTKQKEEETPSNSQQESTEACEVNSQKSDDSDAFATPPLSMSANDAGEQTTLDDLDNMELEEDDGEEWKTVVPEDWVPILARDVIRQRRLPQQAPFSDAYLSGLPPKRRKTADEKAMSSTSENMPSLLRQAVLATGVAPKTSMEALASDARQSPELQEAYRNEVKKAVKRRTSKDTDYNPEQFPSTNNYLDKS